VYYLLEADHSQPARAEALANEVQRIHLGLIEVVDACVRAEKVPDDLDALFVGRGKSEPAGPGGDHLRQSGDWREGYLGLGHLVFQCLSAPDHRVNAFAHARTSGTGQGRKPAVKQAEPLLAAIHSNIKVAE